MTKIVNRETKKQDTPSKFYTFSQNNSGGSFVYSKNTGVSHFVIIEAHTAKEANRYAEDIGIYFDGCSKGRDCRCCGDRWYETSDRDGEPSPMIYSKPVGKHRDLFIKDGQCHSFIHMLDGSIVGYTNPTKTTQQIEE